MMCLATQVLLTALLFCRRSLISFLSTTSANCESLNIHLSFVSRMRLAVLLVLLFTLCDGLNNVSFSNNEPEMFSELFSNWAHPCQRSMNNNAYNQFKHRHVLSRQFNSSWTRAWEDYLTRKNLCGRTSLQSFLSKDYSSRVVRICNGQGNRVGQNMCISQRRFRVYVVQSAVRNGRCEVQTPVQSERLYVTVACEVIENRCLPVHYVRQTRRRPSQLGRTCRP